GRPTRAVLDLRAAREAVGDEQGVRGCRARLRQEDALAAGHRDVVVTGLVAPGAGEAAAARVGRFDLGAHLLEQRLLGADPTGRLVVAVTVQQHPAREGGRLVTLALEELAEVE